MPRAPFDTPSTSLWTVAAEHRVIIADEELHFYRAEAVQKLKQQSGMGLYVV